MHPHPPPGPSHHHEMARPHSRSERKPRDGSWERSQGPPPGPQGSLLHQTPEQPWEHGLGRELSQEHDEVIPGRKRPRSPPLQPSPAPGIALRSPKRPHTPPPQQPLGGPVTPEDKLPLQPMAPRWPSSSSPSRSEASKVNKGTFFVVDLIVSVFDSDRGLMLCLRVAGRSLTSQ